jgi:hypothetical protein
MLSETSFGADKQAEFKQWRDEIMKKVRDIEESRLELIAQ